MVHSVCTNKDCKAEYYSKGINKNKCLCSKCGYKLKLFSWDDKTECYRCWELFYSNQNLVWVHLLHRIHKVHMDCVKIGQKYHPVDVLEPGIMKEIYIQFKSPDWRTK
jgi:hypothetical protein